MSDFKATITEAVGLKLNTYCNAPAPLVVNGGTYTGCSLEIGYDGKHSVTIAWEK